MYKGELLLNLIFAGFDGGDVLEWEDLGGRVIHLALLEAVQGQWGQHEPASNLNRGVLAPALDVPGLLLQEALFDDLLQVLGNIDALHCYGLGIGEKIIIPDGDGILTKTNYKEKENAQQRGLDVEIVIHQIIQTCVDNLIIRQDHFFKAKD